MVSGTIPPNMIAVQPMGPNPVPPPQNAPVAPPQPTSPPPSPPPSPDTSSVALRQSNGTDRVQISNQAMNANRGGAPSAPSLQSANAYQPATPPPPPVRPNMGSQTQDAPNPPAGIPGGMNRPGMAPQTPAQGVQQSGQFLNLVG